MAEGVKRAVTHITGPRRKLVKQLAVDLMSSIVSHTVTTTEAIDAMDAVTRGMARKVPQNGRLLREIERLHVRLMAAFKRALKPYEDELCPTCPKRPRKRKTGRR
jgi:hypothetical protein